MHDCALIGDINTDTLNNEIIMYDVPDQTPQAAPYLLMAVGAEALFYLFIQKDGLKSQQGKWNQGKFRVNDLLTSVGQGTIQEMLKIFAGAFEITIYIYIWEHWRIYPLDATLYTWLFTFISTDLCFYWFHRLAHEVNLMWAGHAIHHSSEYYNLSTALRHSVFQELCSWIFYMPMALFIPPSLFAFHKQFNLLTQFWIHTETIPRLGWLEYVINTPSAHRVHHGRNPYCIDKNYGGALIIWDRMFGTYQAELVYPQVVKSKDMEEKVAFGLTHPINTFNPLIIQTMHIQHVLKSAWQTPGVFNKIKVFLYGPGWHEGTLRLGDPAEIPWIDPQNPPVKYDPIIPTYLTIYCIIQTTVIAGIADYALLRLDSLPGVILKFTALWIVIGFYSVSTILENKAFAELIELGRTILSIALAVYFIVFGSQYQLPVYVPIILTAFYVVSVGFVVWILLTKKGIPK
ncbi:hypothetical protein HDV01_003617 [Terramyces sp. JEL0728]|nr:hypothetical protein HDV01_003617 [Terramyces sp. JEL0728]